jgi:hypothetical protein
MSAHHNGGPAFPITAEQHPNGISAEMGMSLRDYFAAKAMQGELAAMQDQEGDVCGVALDAPDEALARLAKHYYRIADAMLKAREAQA